jgi:hypothetical protein
LEEYTASIFRAKDGGVTTQKTNISIFTTMRTSNIRLLAEIKVSKMLIPEPNSGR